MKTIEEIKSALEEQIKNLEQKFEQDLEYRFDSVTDSDLQFYYDGLLYDIINDYLTDGIDLGGNDIVTFLNSLEGWDWDFEVPSVITITKQWPTELKESDLSGLDEHGEMINPLQ